MRIPDVERVVVVDDWDGVRSLFRHGWTGVSSDRITVYHRMAEPDVAPSVETTTHVDGSWVDLGAVDFLLTRRASLAEPHSTERRSILLDGQPTLWTVRTSEGGWAALSEGLQPIVTILALGVGIDDVRLRTVRPDELDGFDRFVDDRP